VWQQSGHAFESNVVGPRFEQICHDWALLANDTFADVPADVESGVVNDPTKRTQIEVDVVVFGAADASQPRPVLTLGTYGIGVEVSVSPAAGL
jgi:hypothetical protein